MRSSRPKISFLARRSRGHARTILSRSSLFQSSVPPQFDQRDRLDGVEIVTPIFNVHQITEKHSQMLGIYREGTPTEVLHTIFR